jgi:hypothetical protein
MYLTNIRDANGHEDTITGNDLEEIAKQVKKMTFDGRQRFFVYEETKPDSRPVGYVWSDGDWTWA